MAASWFKRELSLGNILSIVTMLGAGTTVIVTGQVRGEVLQAQQALTRLDIARIDEDLDLLRARITVIETQMNGAVEAIALGNARYEAIIGALGEIRVDVARIQTLIRNISDGGGL